MQDTFRSGVENILAFSIAHDSLVANFFKQYIFSRKNEVIQEG
jgi:hypothetical protein